ncbi:uncharacterized protein METZ01_LOCUS254613 [marine metagenome]|uniref:Uncharacterized protein n=1 Tax=marine metagenome TaxID=408172 RepID=A0A382IR67_9ZZZZ
MLGSPVLNQMIRDNDRPVLFLKVYGSPYPLLLLQAQKKRSVPLLPPIFLKAPQI